MRWWRLLRLRHGVCSARLDFALFAFVSDDGMSHGLIVARLGSLCFG